MTRPLFIVLAAALIGMFFTTSARADNVPVNVLNDSGYQIDYYVALPGQQVTSYSVMQPGASVAMSLPAGSVLYARWTGNTAWQVGGWRVPAGDIDLLGVGSGSVSWKFVVASGGFVGVSNR